VFSERTAVLKRFLLILSDRNFDSTVDRGRRALRPRRMVRTPVQQPVASVFNSQSDFPQKLAAREKEMIESVLRESEAGSQVSSTERFSVSHMMTDRSITFCNSRMLPGQGYD